MLKRKIILFALFFTGNYYNNIQTAAIISSETKESQESLENYEKKFQKLLLLEIDYIKDNIYSSSISLERKLRDDITDFVNILFLTLKGEREYSSFDKFLSFLTGKDILVKMSEFITAINSNNKEINTIGKELHESFIELFKDFPTSLSKEISNLTEAAVRDSSGKEIIKLIRAIASYKQSILFYVNGPYYKVTQDFYNLYSMANRDTVKKILGLLSSRKNVNRLIINSLDLYKVEEEGEIIEDDKIVLEPINSYLIQYCESLLSGTGIAATVGPLWELSIINSMESDKYLKKYFGEITRSQRITGSEKTFKLTREIDIITRNYLIECKHDQTLSYKKVDLKKINQFADQNKLARDVHKKYLVISYYPISREMTEELDNQRIPYVDPNNMTLTDGSKHIDMSKIFTDWESYAIDRPTATASSSSSSSRVEPREETSSLMSSYTPTSGLVSSQTSVSSGDISRKVPESSSTTVTYKPTVPASSTPAATTYQPTIARTSTPKRYIRDKSIEEFPKEGIHVPPLKRGRY